MRHDPAILEDACRRLGIRMVVLFGSHAPGGLTPGSGSDVDLAVALERTAERPGFGALFDALTDAFPHATPDPVFLADADPLFRWEIMRTGVLLYGDLDEFLELRAFAYRDFVDSEDLRELERVLFEKKMARVEELIRAAS